MAWTLQKVDWLETDKGHISIVAILAAFAVWEIRSWWQWKGEDTENELSCPLEFPSLCPQKNALSSAQFPL